MDAHYITPQHPATRRGKEQPSPTCLQVATSQHVEVGGEKSRRFDRRSTTVQSHQRGEYNERTENGDNRVTGIELRAETVRNGNVHMGLREDRREVCVAGRPVALRRAKARRGCRSYQVEGSVFESGMRTRDLCNEASYGLEIGTDLSCSVNLAAPSAENWYGYY